MTTQERWDIVQKWQPRDRTATIPLYFCDVASLISHSPKQISKLVRLWEAMNNMSSIGSREGSLQDMIWWQEKGQGDGGTEADLDELLQFVDSILMNHEKRCEKFYNKKL